MSDKRCAMCGQAQKPSPKHDCKLKQVGRKGLPQQYTQEESAVFDKEALRWLKRCFSEGYQQMLKQAGRGQYDANSVAGMASAKKAFEQLFNAAWCDEDSVASRRWRGRDDSSWSDATCHLLPVGVEFKDDSKKDAEGYHPEITYKNHGEVVVVLKGFELVEGDDE